MAGGSKLAFALGKMGSGSGGIKGAAAGVAAVAQAGVMSVAKAGAGKALEAGGAISAAHTNGMRGSMHALSKGIKRMPKADPASGGGDGKGPNWAKKVHRQQKTRHATRAASHAIRSSDSGGGANGPALNPDG